MQLLRTNRRAKLFDCIDRIKSNGLCKIQKFNNINAPLATFDCSHKRLIAPQSFCELGLRQTGFLPLLNKQSDQGLLPRRSERAWHFLPQRQGGRQIIGFTDYLKTRYYMDLTVVLGTIPKGSSQKRFSRRDDKQFSVQESMSSTLRRYLLGVKPSFVPKWHLVARTFYRERKPLSDQADLEKKAIEALRQYRKALTTVERAGNKRKLQRSER